MLEMIRMEIGSFCQKPLLYLFILSIIYSDFKFQLKHLLHFTPLLASTSMLLPRFYLVDKNAQYKFWDDYYFTAEGIFSVSLAHFQTAAYLIASFVIVFKYRNYLLQRYSVLKKLNFKWLFQMNIFLSVLFAVAIIKNVHKYGINTEYLTPLRLIMATGMLGFTCWLFLKALYSPNIFKGIDERLQLLSNKDLFLADQEQVENQKEQILHLKRYIEEQEPYLDPGLTIASLANRLEMDTKALSSLLNHHLHKNFHDFINDYRIRKAKKILKDPTNKQITILEVLYQIGFNTKSSFNTSFKKQTGLTPTEYRRKWA